jgi:hypothetical protein
MKNFLRNNGLSIVFTVLFLAAWAGQAFTGFASHNDDRKEDGQLPITFPEYLHSGHFIQATFENWESEFLQMALFVVLTVSLRQKGSSESKKIDEPEEVDRQPSPQREGAPWAVKKGGWILFLYKRSLSLVLFLLFLLSFALHFYGSLKDENEQLANKGMPPEPVSRYIADNRFWFESFQNWQSEFLSVFTIVVLSIFLRQQGSPQSKPVDAPNEETGE